MDIDMTRMGMGGRYDRSRHELEDIYDICRSYE